MEPGDMKSMPASASYTHGRCSPLVFARAGKGVADASGRRPARRGGFGPDPAQAGVRKGQVGLSGSVWPQMLPARPGGASGGLFGPSRALPGPKTGPRGPRGPPWGPFPWPPYCRPR